MKSFRSKDLTKEELYKAVKQLIDAQSAEKTILHLPQQKLYTLFSAAFQYLLFCSTKKPGAYIIRIEDAHLTDKLSRRAKDPTTRKFLSRLLVPRRLKYNQSTFYLDFFQLTTWQQTSEIPPERLKGALIVKGTSDKIMMDELIPEVDVDVELQQEEEQIVDITAQLPDDYYLESLRPLIDNIVVIAYDKEIKDSKPIHFPFIDDQEKMPSGVIIKENLQFEDDQDL